MLTPFCVVKGVSYFAAALNWFHNDYNAHIKLAKMRHARSVFIADYAGVRTVACLNALFAASVAPAAVAEDAD